MHNQSCSISLAVPRGVHDSEKRNRTWGVLISLAACVIAAALGGCASSESQRTAGVYGRHESLPGGGSAVVFLPEATRESLDAYPDVEHAWDDRRDASIQPRVDQPVLATAEWPQAPRDSLNSYRYIYLPRQPYNVLYFRPEREREHRRWWW